MRITKKVLCVLLALVMAFAMTATTFAAASESDSELQLTVYVYSQLSGKSYSKSGGGSLTGEDLFVGSDTDGYTINETTYNQLTSSAQTDFIKDIKSVSDQAAESNEASTSKVSGETVQNWFKELQSIDGVGSKLMSTVMENTKPDFVTANKLYQPFSGIVGTILGILSILLMAFLGIVMVLDISYIALPPMRMFVGENTQGRGKEHGGGIKSNLVSNDAIYAVTTAENENSDGTKKQALGIYLKRRIPMLILLGVCLLYLVQGQIYTLVSWILDLVSGFLGF